MSDEQETIYKEFNDLVNMKPKELDKWLSSDESQSVGIKKGTSNDKKSSSGGGESTGHMHGRNIKDLLDKNKGDLEEDDFKEMKKVTGYIKRHLKQKPSKEDIKDSRWRYSLMNWGHDPLK